MFVPEHWAAAFINSLETQGGEAAEGIDALKILVSWAKSLPGVVSGSSDAEKLETLVRQAAVAAGMAKTSAFSGGDLSPALEAALRFLVLMVKKNKFRHIDPVIDETKKLLDRKNGLVPVTLEYVLPPGDSSGIEEAIRKRTGAARVEITERVNPELIGGYRLWIGDEIIDASVRSQLQKLEACLTAGNGGN
jgi:F-type H+-transporting ATPase subunit delta